MTLAATLLTALAAGIIQTAPPNPSLAEPPATEEEQGDVDAVQVTSVRPRGSVEVDIEPEVTLGEEDIKALGANNVGELMEQLSSLTASSRGRGGGQPIVLLNGRRTSGFQEVRSIPTEAIERTEVLPEEVALSYGYPADQKVMNIVLKPSFQQTSGRLELQGPTQGGSENVEIGGSYFRVAKGDRWNLQVEYEHENALFENERDIVREGGSRPYDLTGNITGLPYGAEIDPALSALAGQTVIVAAVPKGNTTPGLADFGPTAGVARGDDLSAFRTLSPERERALIEGSVAHDLSGKTQATISGSLEDTSTLSYLGLPGIGLVLPSANPYSPFANDAQLFRYVDAPSSMTRTSDTLTAKAGVVLDGFLAGDWRWTLSGDYSRVQNDSRTGRGLDASAFQAQINAGSASANPFGDLAGAGLVKLPADTAKSVNGALSAELVLSGNLFELPAGPVQSTINLGYDSRSLDSGSLRSGVRIDRSLSRQRYYGKINLSAPLINRDEGPLGLLGDLSINANADYYEASDFGGLFNLGGGVNWSLWEPLNLSASYSREHAAPDIGQLNDPVISTPNVPVFDFSTGQTVLITRVTGGNPGLSADTRQVARFGVNLKPFKERDLFLYANYVWSRTDDAISGFPSITPELEAALPGRFTRDGSGQLIALDARALNFSRTERRDIRLNMFYSFAFGKPTAPIGGGPRGPGGGGPGGGPGAGPRPGGGPSGGPVIVGPGGGGRGPGGGTVVMVGPGGGGPRPGGGPGGFRGGPGGGMRQLPGQGRILLGFNYLHRLQDEIEVRPGLPVIDQLETSGTRRDELQGFARVFKDGNGAGLTFNWRGGSRIDGGTGGTDLTFEPYTTVNLEFSTDLGQRPGLMKAAPWLKGTQLQLNVQNVFDVRQDVKSSTGERPLNYQPDYLDPYGRSIVFRIRKVLF